MTKPKRMAECHPDRPHFAKGLCEPCYRRKQYKKNKKRRLALARKWREKNRERKQELDRNWVKNNKEYKNKIDREWRANNRNRCYEAKLLKRYGLTLLEYDTMFEAQDGICAICGKTPKENGKRLFVDHDHESGVVRGLLCRDCNFLLGYAHDNIYNLSSAISYLEENKV